MAVQRWVDQIRHCCGAAVPPNRHSCYFHHCTQPIALLVAADIAVAELAAAPQETVRPVPDNRQERALALAVALEYRRFDCQRDRHRQQEEQPREPEQQAVLLERVPVEPQTDQRMM